MAQYVITLVVKFDADDDRDAQNTQRKVIDAVGANTTVFSVNSPVVPARLP